MIAISNKAALHSLGNALGTMDDFLIDRKMGDVDMEHEYSDLSNES